MVLLNAIAGSEANITGYRSIKLYRGIDAIQTVLLKQRVLWCVCPAHPLQETHKDLIYGDRKQR